MLLTAAADATPPALAEEEEEDTVGFVRFEMNAGSWSRSEGSCIFFFPGLFRDGFTWFVFQVGNLVGPVVCAGLVASGMWYVVESCWLVRVDVLCLREKSARIG